MVLDADGEKWACEPCIRGHRVSNCTHIDRELKHIAKKGRPVSQCHHCRILRKERSAHVKCDCGEKAHTAKEKCCHLKKGIPPKSQSPPNSAHEHNHDSQPLDLENCQCHETGKCVCALKSDTAEAQPVFSMPPPPTSRRPRLFQTSSSEHHMTVFQNGHHKPVHRNNNAAHECGVPYRIPNFHPAPGTFNVVAHHSTESLPTLDSFERDITTPQTPSFPEGIKTERRMSKSEQTSPLLRPFMNTPPLDGQGSTSQPGTASLDIPYLSGTIPEQSSATWIDTNISCQDSDVGLLSATSLGPDMWPWTGNDLPIGNRNRSESDPLSWAHGNNSLPTQPALTNTSSSGPQSEIDDAFGFEDALLAQQLSGPPSTGSQPVAANELSPWENLSLTENLNLNEPSNNRWSMPSFSGPQASSLGSTHSPFKDYQKESISNQMSTSITNGRPASLNQPSVPYQNLTSQPRSSPNFPVTTSQSAQATLDSNVNLTANTNEWLKDLGLSYEMNASEVYGGDANNLAVNNSVDEPSNWPVGNTLSIDDFEGTDFPGTALLPPTPSSEKSHKSMYTQPHGLPSWSNSSTNLGEVSDDWLR
ncbi:MAG: hypothetical protein Q9157_007139 [Trypethelium eluteriae]